MENQNRDYLGPQNGTVALPNATTTLVLGILSIVVCFICGIIALVLSNKDLADYRANPDAYTSASYSNIKVGRICAIVGICLQVVGLIIYIAVAAFFFTTIATSKNGSF